MRYALIGWLLYQHDGPLPWFVWTAFGIGAMFYVLRILTGSDQ